MIGVIDFCRFAAAHFVELAAMIGSRGHHSRIGHKFKPAELHSERLPGEFEIFLSLCVALNVGIG